MHIYCGSMIWHSIIRHTRFRSIGHTNNKIVSQQIQNHKKSRSAGSREMDGTFQRRHFVRFKIVVHRGSAM